MGFFLIIFGLKVSLVAWVQKARFLAPKRLVKNPSRDLTCWPRNAGGLYETVGPEILEDCMLHIGLQH